MMPYCEYYRCRNIAESTCGLLRKWSSFSRSNSNHHQDIWLCTKHLKKINKIFQLTNEEQK